MCAQGSRERWRTVTMIAARRVLVTSAGGSIGAELVRQAATFGPAQMTLLDGSEYLLYSIGLELGEAHPGLSRSLVLGDVCDRPASTRSWRPRRPNWCSTLPSSSTCPWSRPTRSRAS